MVLVQRLEIVSNKFNISGICTCENCALFIYLQLLFINSLFNNADQRNGLLKSTIINLQSFVASPNTLKVNYRKQVS